jgi:outer membrane protein OmpA-like peptidoglycan-associated protein
MNTSNQLAPVRKRKALVTCLAILIILLLAIAADAQDYRQVNRRHQRAYYKRSEGWLVNACHILNRKRCRAPRRSLLAFHRKPKVNSNTERSVINIQKSEVTASTETKPITKPAPKLPHNIQPKIEQVSEKKLETLHKKEDEVLATNKLPVPTSLKHEEVRKKVADKLASKVNVYPLSLEPLYFQFNQDEFSVVDMEPFLVAAEYALQGRTILIEGHTDTRGQDDFNVKLSIKRVQKIRQLMLDMGVPDERISVVGYGEELGKAKAKTESSHQTNRRVDFTIF